MDITKSINNTNNKVGEFFSLLFTTRDKVHLAHLKTKSYATHIALNEYYDSLLTLLDDLIESYQGKYGLISFNVKTSQSDEPIKTIKELINFCEKIAYTTFKETWILNQIDEILQLSYKTLYKLKELS